LSTLLCSADALRLSREVSMIPTLMRRRVLRAMPGLLCSVFLTAQALAQPAPAVRRADPLDPKATVPALRYESAMAQYRRLSDEKAVDPPASAPPAAKPPGGVPAEMMQKPMPSGHSGHKQP
jgi:hypothetical protein